MDYLPNNNNNNTLTPKISFFLSPPLHSVSAKKHCIQVGIPVSVMAFADGELDLTIDGADEVDVTMALMKGGSGECGFTRISY